MPRPAGILAAWLTLLVPYSLAGSERDPGLDAAIIPDADFLARIDLDAIRRSGFLERLSGGDAETPTLPSAIGPIGRWTELAGRIEASGLAAADVHEIFVSARTDVIEVGASGKRERSGPVPTLTAVSLANAISTEKLAAALAAVWEGRTANLFPIDDAAAIELVSAKPEERSIYAATSRKGTTVYFATDRGSLEGALARERSGAYEKLSVDLTRIEDSFAKGPGARVVVLAPSRFTAKLLGPPGTGAENRPPTMAESMLEPFRSLRSLVLAVDLAEDARIALVGDLSGEEEARNARTLLATMALPNLSRALSTRFGGLVPFAESLTVDGDGSTVRVNLRLSTSDVRTLLLHAKERDPEAKSRAGELR